MNDNEFQERLAEALEDWDRVPGDAALFWDNILRAEADWPWGYDPEQAVAYYDRCRAAAEAHGVPVLKRAEEMDLVTSVFHASDEGSAFARAMAGRLALTPDEWYEVLRAAAKDWTDDINYVCDGRAASEVGRLQELFPETGRPAEEMLPWVAAALAHPEMEWLEARNAVEKCGLSGLDLVRAAGGIPPPPGGDEPPILTCAYLYQAVERRLTHGQMLEEAAALEGNPWMAPSAREAVLSYVAEGYWRVPGDMAPFLAWPYFLFLLSMTAIVDPDGLSNPDLAEEAAGYLKRGVYPEEYDPEELFAGRTLREIAGKA